MRNDYLSNNNNLFSNVVNSNYFSNNNMFNGSISNELGNNNENQRQTTLNLSCVIATSTNQNIMEEKLQILFDSGSQLNYVTPEAKKSLQLQTLGTYNVVLKTFGNCN